MTCVILAPDLERISSEGGLDSAVDNIIRKINSMGIGWMFFLKIIYFFSKLDMVARSATFLIGKQMKFW